MKCEIAYAPSAELQTIIQVEVEENISVLNAILISGILNQYPEIKQRPLRVGIFGKVVSEDTCLDPGDRVEIYRSLQKDPKILRKERAIRV